MTCSALISVAADSRVACDALQLIALHQRQWGRQRTLETLRKPRLPGTGLATVKISARPTF
jgi:hypothetical protein